MKQGLKERNLFGDLLDQKTRYEAMLFLIGNKIVVQEAKNHKMEFTVLDTRPTNAELIITKADKKIICSCECRKSTQTKFCKHVAAGVLLLNKHHYFDSDHSEIEDCLKPHITELKKTPPDLKLVKTKTEKPVPPLKFITPDSRAVKRHESENNRIEAREAVKKQKTTNADILSRKQARSNIILLMEREAEQRAAKARLQLEERKRIGAQLTSLIVPHNEISKPIASKAQLIFVLNVQLSGILITLEKAELFDDGTLAVKGRAIPKDASLLKEQKFEDIMLLDFFFMKGSGFDLGQKLFEYDNNERVRQNPIEFVLYPGMITKILAWENLYWRNNLKDAPAKVIVQPEPYTAVLNCSEDNKGYALSIKLVNDSEVITDLSRMKRLMIQPLTLFIDGKIVTVPNLNNMQFKYFRGQNNNIQLHNSFKHFVEDTFIPGMIGYIDVEGVSIQRISEVQEVKRGILLSENEMTLILKLVFIYDNTMVFYDKVKEREVIHEDGGYTVVSRKKEFENEAYTLLSSYEVVETSPGVFLPRHDAVMFLVEQLDALKADGFEIFGEQDLKNLIILNKSATMSISIKSGIDWFDVEGEVKFGDHSIMLNQLLAAIKKGKQYIRLDDGTLGILPESWVRKFLKILPMGQQLESGLKFFQTQAVLLEEMITVADEVKHDEVFLERLERLKSFSGITEQRIPNEIQAHVRDYQKTGYSWLYFLKEFRFGGILADDMGLGKTLQVLMLLLNEKNNGAANPSLIVAPTSLIFNWVNESAKFTPTLRFRRYTGTERKDEDINDTSVYDVLITTYGLMLNDADLLKKFNFNYIVLDESQKIKNPLSKSAKAAYKLIGANRLCLTGTPIENNLSELWSQFNFINPGMLSHLNSFKESYLNPIQKFDDREALQTLKKITYPFILRRTKELVASELPAKTEMIHYCEMDIEQRKLYEYWKDSVKKGVMQEIEKKGLNRSRIKVIEALLRLRQICNHPYLIGQKEVKRSGKFDEFKLLIESVTQENHKILVFSQFTKMLELMRLSIVKRNIQYALLTGSTRNREEEVDKFQNNPDVKIFLISLKAGGFGLNLTAADYVIHYDPWWNPAAEAQATDRAHRIGQTKNVFVYKFITKETVEEKIILLQERKRALANNVLSLESGGFKQLSADDIKELFA